VRQAIYGALGRLGQNGALPALTGCLEDEGEETTRAVCIQALGQIGDPAALAYLLAAAADKASPLIRARWQEVRSDLV
jgi:HEAT repeat protein